MRAATATRRGPVQRATRRPPGRLASHRNRTDRRGPVSAGDIAGRPSLDEIQNVITRGTPEPISGQNAVRIQQGNVRVIINEDNPLRSTAYYTGH